MEHSGWSGGGERRACQGRQELAEPGSATTPSARDPTGKHGAMGVQYPTLPSGETCREETSQLITSSCNVIKIHPAFGLRPPSAPLLTTTGVRGAPRWAGTGLAELYCCLGPCYPHLPSSLLSQVLDLPSWSEGSPCLFLLLHRFPLVSLLTLSCLCFPENPA